MKPIYQANSKLDLSFTRIVDVPRALVWRAWTEPELLMPWFCPLPWKTIACEIDLRPGGIFSTTMQSPEGKEFPNAGCYLDHEAADINALFGFRIECIERMVMVHLFILQF